MSDIPRFWETWEGGNSHKHLLWGALADSSHSEQQTLHPASGLNAALRILKASNGAQLAQNGRRCSEQKLTSRSRTPTQHLRHSEALLLRKGDYEESLL